MENFPQKNDDGKNEIPDGTPQEHMYPETEQLPSTSKASEPTSSIGKILNKSSDVNIKSPVFAKPYPTPENRNYPTQFLNKENRAEGQKLLAAMGKKKNGQKLAKVKAEVEEGEIVEELSNVEQARENLANAVKNPGLPPSLAAFLAPPERPTSSKTSSQVPRYPVHQLPVNNVPGLPLPVRQPTAWLPDRPVTVRQQVVRQPVARQQVNRQPVARQPVARQQVNRQPVARQQVARRVVVRQRVAGQQVDRQQVAQQQPVQQPQAQPLPVREEPVLPDHPRRAAESPSPESSPNSSGRSSPDYDRIAAARAKRVPVYHRPITHFPVEYLYKKFHLCSPAITKEEGDKSEGMDRMISGGIKPDKDNEFIYTIY